MSGIDLNEEKLNEIEGQELKEVTGGFPGDGLINQSLREKKRRIREQNQKLPREEQGGRDGGATGGW